MKVVNEFAKKTNIECSGRRQQFVDDTIYERGFVVKKHSADHVVPQGIALPGIVKTVYVERISVKYNFLKTTENIISAKVYKRHGNARRARKELSNPGWKVVPVEVISRFGIRRAVIEKEVRYV